MKILEDFRRLPSGRQAGIAISIGIVILLVIIGFGASAISQGYLESDMPTEETEVVEETPEITPEEESTPEEVKSYSGDITAFLETLTTSAWVTDAGSIKFSDHTFTEYAVDASEPTETTFIVKSISYKSTFDLDDTTEAIVEINGQYTTMRVAPSKEKKDEKAVVPMTIECELFDLQKHYIQSIEKSFKVNAIKNDYVLEFINQDTKGLEKALQTYCYTNLPAVYELTWEKSCTIDYDLKTIALNFTCDNASETSLCALYESSTKSWFVKIN